MLTNLSPVQIKGTNEGAYSECDREEDRAYAACYEAYTGDTEKNRGNPTGRFNIKTKCRGFKGDVAPEISQKFNVLVQELELNEKEPNRN